jgi:rhodanese-related sulfurtransferase
MSRNDKSAAYSQLARIGKAFANPIRLELLDLLSQAPRTVEQLAQGSEQSMANTSQHLQVLRRARLVTTSKSGLFVTYRLAHPDVALFFVTLRSLAEARLAELELIVRGFGHEDDDLEAVDRDALAKRVRSGAVTVIDVRPKAEYDAGHIAGALSVPVDELQRQLADLPRDRQVVAYCRGPFCVMARDAVAMLRDKGYDAVRFEDGVADWRGRGFEIERAEATS